MLERTNPTGCNTSQPGDASAQASTANGSPLARATAPALDGKITQKIITPNFTFAPKNAASITSVIFMSDPDCEPTQAIQQLTSARAWKTSPVREIYCVISPNANALRAELRKCSATMPHLKIVELAPAGHNQFMNRLCEHLRVRTAQSLLVINNPMGISPFCIDELNMIAHGGHAPRLAVAPVTVYGPKSFTTQAQSSYFSLDQLGILAFSRNMQSGAYMLDSLAIMELALPGHQHFSFSQYLASRFRQNCYFCPHANVKHRAESLKDFSKMIAREQRDFHKLHQMQPFSFSLNDVPTALERADDAKIRFYNRALASIMRGLYKLHTFWSRPQQISVPSEKALYRTKTGTHLEDPRSLN